MTDFFEHFFDSRNMLDVTGVDELPYWSAAFGIILFDTIKIKPNLRVLDIGFGTGFPLLELAQRLGEGSEIFGVDIWEEAVERTRQKIQERRLKNVTPMIHAAEELPFQNEFFDLVVSNNGLNNVQDLPKVLSEVHRVCKREAQLVFTMNLPSTMMEFYDVYEAVLGDFHMMDEITKMKAHIHEKRKPLDEMRIHLRDAKFGIEREIFSEFSYRFPDGTAMFRYHLIREFFLPSWTTILPADKVREIFSEIERRLNQISAERGELKLTVPFVCMDCRRAVGAP